MWMCRLEGIFSISNFIQNIVSELLFQAAQMKTAETPKLAYVSSHIWLSRMKIDKRQQLSSDEWLVFFSVCLRPTAYQFSKSSEWVDNGCKWNIWSRQLLICICLRCNHLICSQVMSLSNGMEMTAPSLI